MFIRRIQKIKKTALEWDNIQDQYKSLCHITDALKPKRNRTATSYDDFVVYSIPKHVDNFEDSKTDYKTLIYYSVLDMLIDEIERRFNSTTLKIALAVSSIHKGDLTSLKLQNIEKYSKLLSIDLNLALAEFSLFNHSIHLHPESSDSITNFSQAIYPNA